MDGFQKYLIRLLLLVNFIAVFIVIGVAIDRYIRGGKTGIRGFAAGRRAERYDAPGPTLNIEGDTRATVPGGFGAPRNLYKMIEVAL